MKRKVVYTGNVTKLSKPKHPRPSDVSKPGDSK